jgi:ADP-ribose pyrophosphatase YjhB (NUDIX family)
MTRVVEAIIKHPRQERYFLIKPTRDFGEYTGHYYPPGGHLEPGESSTEALIREIAEELSWEVKPIRQMAETPGDVEGQLTEWWECEVVGGELKVDRLEIADFGFFSKEDRERLPLWPATIAFFRDYIDTPNIKGERATS